MVSEEVFPLSVEFPVVLGLVALLFCILLLGVGLQGGGGPEVEVGQVVRQDAFVLGTPQEPVLLTVEHVVHDAFETVDLFVLFEEVLLLLGVV